MRGRYPCKHKGKHELNTDEKNRDEKLVGEHLNGSARAFRRLVEIHAPNIVSLVERMVSDHHLALDISQEVFIKLHEVLPRYRFKGRFRSMLYSMAINRARDALRKKQRSRIVFLDTSRMRKRNDPGQDPAEDAEQRSAIEHALDRVPAPFKEALCLRDVAGLSYKEAADALGCEIGTVKSRVNRGRLAFRDLYTGLTGKNGQSGHTPKGEHHAS